MNNHRRRIPASRAVLVSIFLSALASPSVGYAAESGALFPEANVRIQLSQQSEIQLSVESGLLNGNTSVLLGGTVSGGSNKEGSTFAEAGVSVEGSAELNAVPNDDERARARGRGRGRGGFGSDGGTAPVPEPSTWIGLGTLLAVCLALANSRRSPKNQP